MPDQPLPTGKLLAIAVKDLKDGAMHLMAEAEVSTTSGVAHDPRGKPGNRQVTVLSAESWSDACKDLKMELPWTLRRANLLVGNISLYDSKGKRLRIGDVELEVTFETTPCGLMDEAQPGLRRALSTDWRGGVLCKVMKGGRICSGDAVSLDWQ